MLVLSRLVGEDLVLADGMVLIRIVDVRGDKVKLGIDAPRSLSVHRREVFDAIVRDLGTRPLPRVELAYDTETVPPQQQLVISFDSTAHLRDAMADGFVRFAPNSQLLADAELRRPA